MNEALAETKLTTADLVAASERTHGLPCEQAS
jgi:hypothetical protein